MCFPHSRMKELVMKVCFFFFFPHEAELLKEWMLGFWKRIVGFFAERGEELVAVVSSFISSRTVGSLDFFPSIHLNQRSC